VDGAPDFLMLHSLGGGSGSGLGSRILEHLREVCVCLGVCVVFFFGGGGVSVWVCRCGCASVLLYVFGWVARLKKGHFKCRISKSIAMLSIMLL